MKVNCALKKTAMLTLYFSVLYPLISKIHRNPKTDGSCSTRKASLHPSLQMEHRVCKCTRRASMTVEVSTHVTVEVSTHVLGRWRSQT